MIITHHVGRSVQLAHPQRPELTLWEYVYGGKPKPFFHPLRTPAGYDLSLFQPHDHIWHRGLWFTFKFVNGENFWEENAPFGTQRLVDPPAILCEGPRTTLQHVSEWVRPEGGIIIDERRRIDYTPLGDDAYALDWDVTLTPRAHVLLDRTPFTTWGGYGGLTLRGTRNWQNTHILFDDDTTSERPTGTPHRWAALTGQFDGACDAFGGLAILDHPHNPRHPQPWYGKGGEGHYLNAAILFHEPMPLAVGQDLRLRYRALVHDGCWPAARIEEVYQAWTRNASP